MIDDKSEYLEIRATENFISDFPEHFNKVSCSCNCTFQIMQCDITGCVWLFNLHIKATSIARRLRQIGTNCKICSIVIFNVLSNQTIIRITKFSFHKHFNGLFP